MARPDAHRVPIPGMMQCAIDLKPRRYENEVYINQRIDVTALCEYLAEKKAAGDHYTFFHAFLTAIGKTIYNRPRLNYFVDNRRLWERNDVSIAFSAKVDFDDRAEEVMLVIPVAPEDTMESIRASIAAKLAEARGGDMEKEGANSAIDIVAKLPGIIRVPFFGLMKQLDQHGHLPAGLRKDNLYYSSMIVSNLGSLQCDAIYHNVTNFGTASAMAIIGQTHTTTEELPDGTKQERKYCEFGFTIDERVGDGYYFVKSVKLLQAILDNPECLMEPAGTIMDVKELR